MDINNGVGEIFEGYGTKPKISHMVHWLLVVFISLTISIVMYLGLSDLFLEPLYVWMYSILYAITLGWFVHMFLRNERLVGCLIFHLILYLVSAIYLVSTDIDCWMV